MKTVYLLYTDFGGDSAFERVDANHPYFQLGNGRQKLNVGEVHLAKIKLEAGGKVGGRPAQPLEMRIAALSDHQLDDVERQGVCRAATKWAIEQGLVVGEVRNGRR